MSKYHHKARDKGKKKAISPVIATVILIAITLIAAVAIGGFVFGLFGSFTSSAQVSVTGADITTSAVSSTFTTNTYTCMPAGTSSSTLKNYTVLSNTGTSSALVTSVSIKVNGTNIPLTAASSAPCSVPAGGILYLAVIQIRSASVPSGSVSSGTEYLLTVTLSNGGQVPYQGQFQ
ncbi:MAG: type IV pilin N-terminal domain-containing protein [Nitrososphaerota archaeon]